MGDIAGRLVGSQPQLAYVVSKATGRKRRSLLNVVAYVLTGVSNAFFGKLSNLYDQILPDTQSSDNLSRTASLYLPGGRKLATPAQGNWIATGADGVRIPMEGTQLMRADGALFSVTADMVIAGGTATVPIQAVLAGADGNTAAATPLTLVSPIAGVTSTGDVDANGLTGGADQETDAALLQRLKFRWQYPPKSGTVADYVFWATNQPGVTRAFVTPRALGPNSVTVRCVNDNQAPITLTGGQLTALAAAVGSLDLVTAQLTLINPTLDATAYSIHLVPSNADTQAAVTASLQEMHVQLCSVGGCTLPDGTAGGTLDLSDIRQAIKTADGVTDYTITLINGIAPANVVSAAGHLAILGAITWV